MSTSLESCQQVWILLLSTTNLLFHTAA